MNTPDRGVPTLFQRATDDLRPDIEHLVSGGITRGRARRRRAQIGTAVATVAVFGVIGVAATVVPPNASPDSARDPGFATQAPTPTATGEAPLDPATGLAVQAEEFQETVNLVLARNFTAADPEGMAGGDETSGTAAFLYNGMLTDMTIEVGSSTIAQCAEAACEELPDGSTRLEWGPTTADGVTAQGITWWRRGYEVSVISYNAAKGKDSPPLAPEPALTKDELREVAGSDVWFTVS